MCSLFEVIGSTFLSSSKRGNIPSFFNLSCKRMRVFGLQVGVTGRPVIKLVIKNAAPPATTGSSFFSYILGIIKSAAFTKSETENSSKGSLKETK